MSGLRLTSPDPKRRPAAKPPRRAARPSPPSPRQLQNLSPSPVPLASRFKESEHPEHRGETTRIFVSSNVTVVPKGREVKAAGSRPALHACIPHRGQRPQLCVAHGGAHRLLSGSQLPNTTPKYQLRITLTEKEQIKGTGLARWVQRGGGGSRLRAAFIYRAVPLRSGCIRIRAAHRLCFETRSVHSGENIFCFVIMCPALLLILERHEIRLFSY